jgi:glycosyltransferase involved in cell wall biosynthesis
MSLSRKSIQPEQCMQHVDGAQALAEFAGVRTRLLRLALWAQRRMPIPGPIRTLARRTFGRVMDHRLPDGPTEDWSIPLIPGRGSGSIETVGPLPVDGPADLRRVTAGPPAAIDDRPVRCAIATAVLDVGGAEEIAAFLARRLPERGISTVVVHTGTHLAGQTGIGGRLVRVLADAGVETVDLTPTTAPRWFASYRPDVVSGHYAPDWLLTVAMEAGVPWVETIHGMHRFMDQKVWPLERQRAKGFAAQIAISDLVEQQYRAGNPDYPHDQIVTVPNGAEERDFTPVDRVEARAALGLRDEFLFLSLGRYCLQKNTYALVSAFSSVAEEHPEAHLLCAGRAADDLWYFEQTRQHATSLPGADRIHLRGHCANVSALLAAADAFVLASFFEGFPLASMKAAASGIPVIMTDVGGAREQVGMNGERGYLVANPAGHMGLVDWRTVSDLRFRPQSNRTELVAAMSAVIRQRESWNGRRTALRARARDLFPADASLNGHARVLRSVALGRPIRDPSAASSPR